MSKLTLFKTSMHALLLVMGVALPGAIAEGVTTAALDQDTQTEQSLTTGAVVRARADLQIRRLKSLMVSKTGALESDADYEKLEKLQKDLRGER